ncbi:MAG: nucleoside diphosphate kinase regulator [Mesorhizobium sp.]|uniref:nucleoside diphosphate kinase regulator n=1 Tax=Mesorhizobium sp. TaxID=1871066 RepID=UPI001ACE3ECD|nr:nucleoside diphosphate kinase regulator [Mesorhizobium sp.]MBN9216466.1 nucleoside diphosphate kinase regulator [Mesorhizobium sp.]
MHHATGLRSSSQILISDTDHDRLTVLARGLLDRAPETAEELLSEMDRAIVTDAAAMPAGVVRMGSTVTVRGESGDIQRVTLVYPGEADIAESRVSVLTPMGTALIGAGVGQTVWWSGRGGRQLSVTVEAVDMPASGQS